MAINIIDPNAPGQAHVDSYWSATSGPEITDAAPVRGDMDVDIAIIGGGVGGASIAYHLTALQGGECHELIAAKKTPKVGTIGPRRVVSRDIFKGLAEHRQHRLHERDVVGAEHVNGQGITHESKRGARARALPHQCKQYSLRPLPARAS